jgi:hypothetical protein
VIRFVLSFEIVIGAGPARKLQLQVCERLQPNSEAARSDSGAAAGV